MRTYFYRLLARYLALFVLPQNSLVEVDPVTSRVLNAFPQGAAAFRQPSRSDAVPGRVNIAFDQIREQSPDYILLSGLVHQERDIQALLASVHAESNADTRLIITYYSSLWRPLMRLASRLGLRERTPEPNWLAHQDIDNLLYLENFELIRRENKVIFPVWVPLLSDLANRYLAPLPFFRLFCLVNIVVASGRSGRATTMLTRQKRRKKGSGAR